MSLRHRKPSELALPDEEGSPLAVAKRQQKRWRLAFAVICFTRALVSLSRKALEQKKQIFRSLSYVAIDVDNQHPHEDGVAFLNADQKILSSLVRDKSLESLSNLGGVKKVAQLLETDEKNGVQGNEAMLLQRINIFGSNTYEKPLAKSFFSFVYEAFKDTTILILLVCAILSLAFGIKQHGLKEGWYDGGSIIVAIFLVVAVSSVSNFKQNRQFEKLSSESGDIKVEVVRDGRRQTLSIFEVVVGDVVCLKIGDQIPADGLFLEGHSLKVDESSMTGESDSVEINSKENPFMLSGTKVTDGYGFMMVTSVGMSTAWGEMMSSISRDLDEQTPLQVRLNKLTSYIGKIGLAVAVMVLLVLLIRYFTGNTTDENGNREFNGIKTKFDEIMNVVVRIIAAAVTIVVVAIPEGLPLAVTLTLAYSMKRMMADNALVRKLSACETMGSATTICTDKTGTLTLNEMKVTEFWVGKEAMEDFDMATDVYELLRDGVGLNTIGTVYKSNSASTPEISGSPTEKAILSWAVLDMEMNLDESKQNCDIIHVETFNSQKKRSGVLMRRINEKVVHTHWKGAAEMILAMCSHYYDRRGTMKFIDSEERMQIGTVIKGMAAKSLRCIAFAYTNVAEEIEETHEKLEESGLTLLGIVGLKDPCRPGVEKAVESCKKAGVNVKMITGDNIHTARAIAIECGILRPSEELNTEAVVEGVQFRNYSDEERMAKIDKISVMARSSPFDKLLMVQCLKQKGHVVAVTGDGTNDAPALKEADIGLSMGIQGTEVAKESSDIIILDDNFSSVVTVLRWGRCVYNNIQKFIQFQLTVNVAALVINFIAAVSSGDVPLTAVQLLWVNLIMDTLGALALATERPTNQLMTKPPVGRSAPLITKIMWRNLVAQALYQVNVLLVLQFKGRSIFNVDEQIKNTLIFNTFVFCQIFNEFNARNLEKQNIFKGLHKNKLFIGIVGATVILQIVMVEFLNRFSNTKRLNWGQWGACVGVASMSWLIGWLVKLIPVSGIQFLFFSKRGAPAT
ncbi:putative calcium-transporting ATPase 13, plasma membrane-type [Mangifera indica]|uniref:putative calcium-transporting ATPase 13, plasma membrane-type n=1 Tax=Mangifera indica TaxID=29780 RepID=UPI001CF93190|nr:putative calcium-transporting ATPase 13, plasma membrane-type [Mangifera indica]